MEGNSYYKLVEVPGYFRVSNILGYLDLLGKELIDSSVCDYRTIPRKRQKGVQSVLVFMSGRSATGVVLVYDRNAHIIECTLSPYAVADDVYLFGCVINAILKKHHKACLFDATGTQLKRITLPDMVEMLHERQLQLKQLLQQDDFVLTGMNCSVSKKAELSGIVDEDAQLFRLQQVFVSKQWKKNKRTNEQ